MSQLKKAIHVLLLERHGNPYASDKVAEINCTSNADVLEWASTELDPRNQRSLMRALGLPEDTMMALRRAFDAARRVRVTEVAA